MKSLLLIIDLQNAFINEHTKELPEKINALIQKNIYNEVVFTMFMNKKNSIYEKN